MDNFSYYHRECYNQFTRAVSELKKREKLASSVKELPSPSSSTAGSASKNEPGTRPKRSSEKYTAGRFPEYCMLCKTIEERKRKRDQESVELPSKFTLETRVALFQKAAKDHQDKEMLDAIKGIDLLVKDL